MPLKLLDIEGENSFSIYDKGIDNKLKNISFIAQQDLPEERIEPLKKDLEECIGYKTAQKLTTSDQIREAAQEEREVLLRNKLFLKRFIAYATRIASERVGREDHTYARRELRRDAIYHTLTRSGILVLSEAFGQEIDEEKAAQDIHLHNKTLQDYLPQDFSQEMLNLLNESMIDNLKRQEFLSELKNRFGLRDEQLAEIDNSIFFSRTQSLDELVTLMESHVGSVEMYRSLIYDLFYERGNFDRKWQNLANRFQIDSANLQVLENELRKRHKGISTSQPFRIGRALNDLYRGNTSIDSVLSRHIIEGQDLYPLVKLLPEIGFKRLDVQHFHTTTSTHASQLKSQWVIGNSSMPQKILLYLADLTGEDPNDYINRWSIRGGGSALLHPTHNYSDNILGELFGHFILGQYAPHYSLFNNSEDDAINLIEKTGRLSRRLEITEILQDYGGFYRGIRTPAQLVNILDTIKNKPKIYQTEEFAEEAFKALVKERSQSQKPHLVTIPTEYDSLVKELAGIIGLDILYGRVQTLRRDVSIRNPERFGIVGPSRYYPTLPIKPIG